MIWEKTVSKTADCKDTPKTPQNLVDLEVVGLYFAQGMAMPYAYAGSVHDSYNCSHHYRPKPKGVRHIPMDINGRIEDSRSPLTTSSRSRLTGQTRATHAGANRGPHAKRRVTRRKCANLRKDVLILLQCPDASGRCRHGRFRSFCSCGLDLTGWFPVPIKEKGLERASWFDVVFFLHRIAESNKRTNRTRSSCY